MLDKFTSFSYNRKRRRRERKQQLLAMAVLNMNHTSTLLGITLQESTMCVSVKPDSGDTTVKY